MKWHSLSACITSVMRLNETGCSMRKYAWQELKIDFEIFLCVLISVDITLEIAYSFANKIKKILNLTCCWDYIFRNLNKSVLTLFMYSIYLFIAHYCGKYAPFS